MCAEYLQAYLPDTGDATVMLGGLVVLGPLYGGAVLLIREIALRTGRGWPGVLLMAAAFGLLMTSNVDRSMWLEHDPEIAYWDELRTGTLLGALGFAAYPVLTWVVGHVVFSIGVPLVLLHALAPSHRARPLLGRAGLGVVAVSFLGAALLIRTDAEYDLAEPTAAQGLTTLLVVAALGGLAMTRLGGPRRRRGDARPWSPSALVGITMMVLLVGDLVPPTWAGLVGYVVLLSVVGGALSRVARSPRWQPAHTTALAIGAVVERTLTGLLAPLPSGVSPSEKAVQSALLISLTLGVAWLAWRRGVRPNAIRESRGTAQQM